MIDDQDILLIIVIVALIVAILTIGMLAGEQKAYSTYAECRVLKNPPEKCTKWLEVK